MLENPYKEIIKKLGPEIPLFKDAKEEKEFYNNWQRQIEKSNQIITYNRIKNQDVQELPFPKLPVYNLL